MSAPKLTPSDPLADLAADRRHEGQLVWKGILAAILVAVVICLRQLYFV